LLIKKKVKFTFALIKYIINQLSSIPNFYKGEFMKKYLSFSLTILIFLAMACSNNNSTAPVDNNKPFSFDSLTIEKDSMQINDFTKINAHAQGSSLTYNWVASAGTIGGNGALVSFTYCCAAVTTIKCTVSDNNNHSSTKEVKVITWK
jgi:hypothetical protein